MVAQPAQVDSRRTASLPLHPARASLREEIGNTRRHDEQRKEGRGHDENIADIFVDQIRTDRLHARQVQPGISKTENRVGAAADDNRDEGHRRIVLSEEGRNRRRHREHAASDTAERRAKAEGKGVDLSRVNAESARHRGIFHRRLRLRAQLRPTEDGPDTGDEANCRGKHNEAVNTESKWSNVEATEWGGHVHDRWSKYEKLPLAYDKTDAPRNHQRGQELIVEMAYDEPFDNHPGKTGAHSSQNHREGRRNSGVERTDRDISPDHHQFAMGHVDHAHDAIDHNQTNSG